MKCPVCGVDNANGLAKCGNCGKPLPSEGAVDKDREGDRAEIEERWSKVVSATPPVVSVNQDVLNLGSTNKDFKLASRVLIAAMVILIIGFALQVYTNEKIDGLYSGELAEMMDILEDMESIQSAAKWAGYLQTLGLILLAAGLIGISVGLSKNS